MLDNNTTEMLLKPGTVSVVGGRPAMGKTAFAVDFARLTMHLGKRVVFISYETEKEGIKGRFETFEEIPESLTIINDPNTDVEKRIKYLEDTDLVIIDYLQLCCEGKGDGFIKRLKKKAEKGGFAILILSQLSRAIESRRTSIPRLTDLLQSYVIDDADNILFLYREAYYDFNAPRSNAQIIVAKHEPYVIETKWQDKAISWDIG